MFDRFDVSVGFFSKIGIKKYFFEKLPKPFSDCEVFQTNEKMILESITYTERMCFLVNKQKINYDKCKCYDVEKDCKECGNSTFCYKKNETDCLTEYASFGNNECNKICKSECNLQFYQFRLNTIRYPTNTYKLRYTEKSDILNNMFSNNEIIQDKILRMSVYIEDYYYEFVSETPLVTIPNLIAYIGGTLGLFLGVSILSFFEIFEILFHIFVVISNKRNL